MSDFDKLMGELQALTTEQAELAKALPADNGEDEEKIQAAAAEGGAGDGDGDKGGMPDGDADDKGQMAKSFMVTLEDGTQVEAQDGTELVKSLVERINAKEGVMAKALEQTLNLVKGQADMIKSLSEKVAKLSNEGRGRKAVVSVVEKPAPDANTGTMVKSHQGGSVSHDEFFAKALTAQKAGRISGAEISLAETLLNRGQKIPDDLVTRVMQ